METKSTYKISLSPRKIHYEILCKIQSSQSIFELYPTIACSSNNNLTRLQALGKFYDSASHLVRRIIFTGYLFMKMKFNLFGDNDVLCQ